MKNQIHLQPFFALQTGQQFLSLRLHCYDPVQKFEKMLFEFFSSSTRSFCFCSVMHHNLQFGARFLAARAIPDVMPPPEIGT